jgi:hypothetical protein
VSELYRPSECRLSAKLVPTFADRGYHVVSVTDVYGRILGSLERSIAYNNNNNNKTVALVVSELKPTERMPLVGEVSTNFCE